MVKASILPFRWYAEKIPILRSKRKFRWLSRLFIFSRDEIQTWLEARSGLLLQLRACFHHRPPPPLLPPPPSAAPSVGRCCCCCCEPGIGPRATNLMARCAKPRAWGGMGGGGRWCNLIFYNLSGSNEGSFTTKSRSLTLNDFSEFLSNLLSWPANAFAQRWVEGMLSYYSALINSL